MDHIDFLVQACNVCERGAAIALLRNVTFKDKHIHAFNGIYQYQAPSIIDDDPPFAVSHTKVANAIRASGDGAQLSVTPEFLRIKNGPFTVRVKKLKEFSEMEPIPAPPRSAQAQAEGLREALRKVHPFMSSDASRPWSVSIMLDKGFAWATNNLALVRTPINMKDDGVLIPGGVADFICDLPSIDSFSLDGQGRIVIGYGESLIRFPQAQALWPNVSNFLAAMPATLPAIPREMMDAAVQVSRFADRFVSIDAKSIQSKSETMETDYEIDFKESKGVYSAALLALILSNASHADFSTYPEPIFFRGEAIEGTAVGIKQA